jgi:hypothetical protein
LRSIVRHKLHVQFECHACLDQKHRQVVVHAIKLRKDEHKKSTRPPEASLYRTQELVKLVMLQSIGNITPSARFLGRS